MKSTAICEWSAIASNTGMTGLLLEGANSIPRNYSGS